MSEEAPDKDSTIKHISSESEEPIDPAFEPIRALLEPAKLRHLQTAISSDTDISSLYRAHVRRSLAMLDGLPSTIPIEIRSRQRDKISKSLATLAQSMAEIAEIKARSKKT